MSLTLGVNFLKGWPCPSIVDFVGKPASGLTPAEGLICHRNSAGQWVAGISDATQIPYVLWNGANGGDGGVAFNVSSPSTQTYAQTFYGGVQGISLINQIEFETSAYSGTPVFGDQLYADTDGLLKVCVGSVNVSGKIIVAVVTGGVHKMSAGPNNANVITVIPDGSKRTS